jgi:hypothetical protein
MIYKLNKSILSSETVSVNLTDDNGQVWTIPFDPANTDYQAYLKWVSEGGVPTPADE